MKKILLGLVAAFAFTTVAPMIAHAEDAAPAEKPAKAKKGKKAKKEGEEKKEEKKAE
ncbi:MAG TPA: hypothetical protein VFF06_30430 [Polyangia bacterium]|nr:hypothetical protein [Polyangia bacterium]